MIRRWIGALVMLAAIIGAIVAGFLHEWTALVLAIIVGVAFAVITAFFPKKNDAINW